MTIRGVSAAVFGLAAASGAAAAEQVHRVDPASGIETWESSSHGVTISLTQILPDQARAFYVNRGFPAAAIEDYATACVFMTVLRNDAAPGTVHFRPQDWTVVSAQGTAPPIAPQTWLDSFAGKEVPPGALVAFRWAQFPVEQSYEPGGDWNQGMLTTGLSAGDRFDLIVRWDVAGAPQQGVLKDVRCSG